MKKLLFLLFIPIIGFSQSDNTKIDSINQANLIMAKQLEMFQTGATTLDSILTDTVLMFVLYNNGDVDVKTDTCYVIKRATKAVQDPLVNRLVPQWFVFQVFHLRSRKQIPNGSIWNFKEIK